MCMHCFHFMNEINDEGPRYRLATVFFNAINLTRIPIIIPDEIKIKCLSFIIAQTPLCFGDQTIVGTELVELSLENDFLFRIIAVVFAKDTDNELKTQF